MDFWVYIFKCADRSYYTGHTDDREKRVSQHRIGEPGGYTYLRRPVTVVYSEMFASRDEAFAAERRIKGWNRAKNEALIARDWDRIRSWRGKNGKEIEPASVRPSIRPPFDARCALAQDGLLRMSGIFVVRPKKRPTPRSP